MKLFQLENKMVKFQDLLSIKVKANNEPLMIIDPKIIPCGYLKNMSDMKKLFKNKIIVRKRVYKKLIKAQKDLKKINPSFSLYITYGYRSPAIQTRLFLKQLTRISCLKFFPNPFELYEEVHRFIAVPTVAGHPTGGAVDVLIDNADRKRFLDFGSKIYDFSTKKCYAFFPNISKQAKNNRLLLRKIMLENGFASFDGEWWHFSYGDREWACYYKKKNAIYNHVLIRNVFPSIND